MSGLCLGLSAFGQSRDKDSTTVAGPPEYDLTWHTIDGGGAMFSASGDYELSGTIGQPDAGSTLTGDNFELTGGFWFVRSPGDCDADGGVTLFDYESFSACTTTPGTPVSDTCVCSDLDLDGSVDLVDFGLFQAAFAEP